MTSRNAVINALRKKQTLAKESRQRARTGSVPFPHKGLNARDDLPRIPATQAKVFTNIESKRDGIRPIPHASVFASLTGVSIAPKTLMVYTGASSSVERMFCGADKKVWSIKPDGGEVSVGAAVASGFSTGLLGWANVNGRLVVADGYTAQQSFDGTTWSNEPMSVASGQPALNTNLLCGIYPFKNRVYWWRQYGLGFWYSTLDTIGDSLKYFDLSYVARKGGDLLKMTRYTHDGGAGPDDYPVFITSHGEAIIYQGTNPNDANAWALVGSFNLGKPPSGVGLVSHRPQKWPLVAEWGAQSFVITEHDFVQLPKALLTEGVTQPSLLSGIIRDAFETEGVNWGWEAVFYPKGPWLLFNIPLASASYGNWTNPKAKSEQYIINLDTGASSRITHHNGRAWVVYDGDLYFTALASTSGSPSLIKKAACGAANVSIEILTGPTKLGSNRPKAIKAAHIWTDANSYDNHVPSTASATMAVITNFREDVQSVNDEVLRIDEWVLFSGVGTYVSMHISGPVNINTVFRETQYIWEEADLGAMYRDYNF